jgi:hypothetical protein
MLNSTKDFHELDFHLFLLHIPNESSYLHHGLGDFTATKQSKRKKTNKQSSFIDGLLYIAGS